MMPAGKIYLTQAIMYNNKYYCFFDETALYDSFNEIKYFFVISKDGNIEHNVQIPQGIDDEVYYDLHIRNDRVITKTYMDHQTYCLDTVKSKWVKIKEVDDRVFEDEKYYVTFLDFGEWGSTIWFKDKKTGIEYEAYAAIPVINKLDDHYYITSGKSVVRIDDPQKMHKAEPSYYYEKVKKKKFYHNGSNSELGTETLFSDTTRFDFDPKFYVATSFICENKLYHLCVDHNNVSIDTLDNGVMKPLQTIRGDFSIGGWFYSYRSKIQKDNSQLLMFESKKDDLFGFIELNGKKISIHYLKTDIDSIKYSGSLNTGSAFTSIFDFVTSNPGMISLDQVDSIEGKMGGLELNPDEKVVLLKKDFPYRRSFDFERSKNYLKIEDSLFTDHTTYYCHKNSTLVKSVSFEWIETTNYHQSNELPLPFNNGYNVPKNQKFNVKFDEIKRFITLRFGKPILDETNSYKNIFVQWMTNNGVKIILQGTDFSWNRTITLGIFQD